MSKRFILMPDSISQMRDILPLSSLKRMSMALRLPLSESLSALREF